MSWKEYFKKQENRNPREQLIRAVSLCEKRKYAFDLGSGNFIESKFLIKNGFKSVIAIDNSSELTKYTKNLNKRITFKNVSFTEIDFSKNKFDLINAQFSLPFYGEKEFDSFIENIINSLAQGGVFVGQFFGNKDSFNNDKNSLVFHSKNKVLKMLSRLQILEFIEEEREGKVTSGKYRHWHVFHFIAKRK